MRYESGKSNCIASDFRLYFFSFRREEKQKKSRPITGTEILTHLPIHPFPYLIQKIIARRCVDDEIWYDSNKIPGTFFLANGKEWEKLYMSGLRVRDWTEWFWHDIKGWGNTRDVGAAASPTVRSNCFVSKIPYRMRKPVLACLSIMGSYLYRSIPRPSNHWYGWTEKKWKPLASLTGQCRSRSAAARRSSAA